MLFQRVFSEPYGVILNQAREIVRTMKTIAPDDQRSDELIAFVPFLPELQTKERLRTVLQEVCKIGDHEDYARLLLAVVFWMGRIHKGQVVTEILDIVGAMRNRERANAFLVQLIPYLPTPPQPERIEEIWAAAINIEDPVECVKACAILSPLLPSSLLERAVEEARELPDKSTLNAPNPGHESRASALDAVAVLRRPGHPARRLRAGGRGCVCSPSGRCLRGRYAAARPPPRSPQGAPVPDARG
jgi:hypothetical protein